MPYYHIIFSSLLPVFLVYLYGIWKYYLKPFQGKSFHEMLRFVFHEIAQ